MTLETYTLILMTFMPISMDRVNVHVERQEVQGLSKAQCQQARREAKRDRRIKAQCVRE